jgi:hypothetical protein
VPRARHGLTPTPHPEMCDGDPLTDRGWYSVDRRFAVSYGIRQQVRLSRRDAADLAEEALARRFPFYGYSSGSSTRCRHTATWRHTSDPPVLTG